MKCFATLLLLLVAISSIGQQRQGPALLDSLLAELSRTDRDDTARAGLLIEISFAYCTADPREGIRYGEKAMALSKRLRWRKGEALAYNELGNNYRNQADYPRALDRYFKSLRIHEERADRLNTGVVDGNIGVVYFYQESYIKALEYLSRSLEIARETGDRQTELTAIGNIGNVYYAQRSYSDALTYLQQALRLAEALDDQRGVMNQLGNMANVYAEMGDHPQALASYFRTLRIAEAEGDQQVVAANEGNIGETYLDMVRDTAKPLSAAARAANLQLAVEHLQRGIMLARGLQFNDAVIDFLHTLSEAYEAQGEHSNALEAHRQYTALKDSVFSLENNEKIAGLETERAVELKNKDLQIAQLEVDKKRSERWLYVGGLVLLLAIVGILARSFRKERQSNALLTTEKNRSDALLRNILPDEVAQELKENGEAAARQYSNVSVLFTDFIDFTTTAEQLPPTVLVRELHECFTAFDAIVERAGLGKIKTIGDAYMAVCGLPVSDPLHAQKTVRAAREILHFIEERRARERAFQVRIGINSGPVVAGIVGVKKFAYDIWGDTVNTAARMEQHGIAGAINISQSTYDLVKDDFRCDYRGMVAAKHKGNVAMYLVVAPDVMPGPEAA